MITQTLDKPTIVQLGDAMQFQWPGIKIELDRFRETRGDDLTAEMLVYNEMPPAPGMLHNGKLNLVGSQGRASVIKALTIRAPDVDWGGVLESVCFHAKEMYRRGDPAVDLREVEQRSVRWMLPPYIEYGGSTTMYGDGGSCKSFTALWLAVRATIEVQPYRPSMYVDWEADRYEHAGRLRAIYAGLRISDPSPCPPVYYRRMYSSLTQSAAALRREIDELDVGFVVIDSLGRAGDGPPEESGTALSTQRAIDSLKVSVLSIHHTNKGGGAEKQSLRNRMFGSAYYNSNARLVYAVESAQRDDQGATTIVSTAMTMVKSNNGRIQRPHGLELTFENSHSDPDDTDNRLARLTFRKADIKTMPEFATKVPLKDRIMGELLRGDLSSEALVEEFDDVTEANVRTTLSRLKAAGQVVKLAGGTYGAAVRD